MGCLVVSPQVHEPVSKFSLELLPVSTVMRSPVVTLELHMKVRSVAAAALSRCCCRAPAELFMPDSIS